MIFVRPKMEEKPLHQCQIDGYRYYLDAERRATKGELDNLVEKYNIDRIEQLQRFTDKIIELGFDAEKSEIEKIACEFHSEILPQFSNAEIRKFLKEIAEVFFQQRLEQNKDWARRELNELFKTEEKRERSIYTLDFLVDMFSTRVLQGPLYGWNEKKDLSDPENVPIEFHNYFWIKRWHETIEIPGKGMPGVLSFLGILEGGLQFNAQNLKSGATGVLQIRPGENGPLGHPYVKKMMKKRIGRELTDEDEINDYNRVLIAGYYIDFYYEKFGDYLIALNAYHAGPTNTERVRKDFLTIAKQTQISLDFTPENIALFGGDSDWKLLLGSNLPDSTKGDFGVKSRNYASRFLALIETYREFLAKNPEKYFIPLPMITLNQQGVIYPCDLESNPHQTDPSAICENPTLPFPPDFKYLADNRPKLNPKD